MSREHKSPITGTTEEPLPLSKAWYYLNMRMLLQGESERMMTRSLLWGPHGPAGIHVWL